MSHHLIFQFDPHTVGTKGCYYPVPEGSPEARAHEIHAGFTDDPPSKVLIFTDRGELISTIAFG